MKGWDVRMKKIISCFLLMCMLFTVTVSAEEIDLSNLSVEELISLHTQVDELLAEKSKCELDVIYQGYYVVGEDIKAGDYLLTRIDDFDEPFWIITIYESKEDEENYNDLSTINLHKGDNAQLNLKDGMIVEFTLGYGLLEVIEKPSWKP